MKTQGLYGTAAISAGGDKTVLTVNGEDSWGPGRGTCFYVRSAIAGTLKIIFIDRDGLSDAGNIARSQVLAAGTLEIIDFDLPLPRFKITFGRTGSDSGTVNVEVFGY